MVDGWTHLGKHRGENPLLDQQSVNIQSNETRVALLLPSNEVTTSKCVQIKTASADTTAGLSRPMVAAGVEEKENEDNRRRSAYQSYRRHTHLN